MTSAVFITGTDTHVGKTFVTQLLLQHFNACGYSTLGLKPLASGCYMSDDRLVNDDALLIQRQASLDCPYGTINPLAFQPPIAPHIAAGLQGMRLTHALLVHHIENALQQVADVHCIEGAGGWALPLNEKELFCDVIVSLGIPVILVVPIQLGCLNHAIVTAQHIQATKATCIGWVANCIDANMLQLPANIQTLNAWLPCRCLGIVTNDCKDYRVIDIKLIVDVLL